MPGGGQARFSARAPQATVDAFKDLADRCGGFAALAAAIVEADRVTACRDPRPFADRLPNWASGDHRPALRVVTLPPAALGLPASPPTIAPGDWLRPFAGPSTDTSEDADEDESEDQPPDLFEAELHAIVVDAMRAARQRMRLNTARQIAALFRR